MSDVENQSSPAMEEMDESGDFHPQAEIPAKAEPSKTPEKKKSPEKTKTPVKKDEKSDEEEEDDEEEEPPLGLLEQPVVLESGKREKKKVERLSMTINLPGNKKKSLEIPEGTGTKLGDCPRIEHKLGTTKAMDLKSLHRILFLRNGAVNEVKKNIRQFSGFTFKKGDKEYEKRTTSLNKMTLPQLKQICVILDVERKGTKADVVERIMEFLLEPHSSGMKVPSKKRKRKSKGEGDKKGTKRKRTSKKDSKAKSKKETVSDISDSDEDEEKEKEEEEDEEEEEEKEEEKSESEAEDSEEEEKPPKKKAKVEKKEAPKKENKAKKQNGKQEKAPKKEKKEAKKVSDSDDSDSDDEPLAAVKDSPPSNDELKDVIKKILEGANLEEVTMKTVVKQVYDKYPSFDLTERKDFIKTTVKQLIS